MLHFLLYWGSHQVIKKSFKNKKKNFEEKFFFVRWPGWRHVTSDDVIKKIKFSIFTGIPSCDTFMFKGDKYEYFSEKIIKKIHFEDSYAGSSKWRHMTSSIYLTSLFDVIMASSSKNHINQSSVTFEKIEKSCFPWPRTWERFICLTSGKMNYSYYA